jgi:hypothetical protein
MPGDCGLCPKEQSLSVVLLSFLDYLAPFGPCIEVCFRAPTLYRGRGIHPFQNESYCEGLDG